MHPVSQRDIHCIWHPLTQMQDMIAPPPVSHGEGATLVTLEGKRIVDGISSWWVNIHGHGNPALAKALSDQAAKFSQVIFANFTHEPAVELAERLCEIVPGEHSRAFFVGDGSSATEAALKMALQFWANRGTPRSKILALDNGYHGDTFGAMSAGARSHYTAPFQPLLFDVEYIAPPYRFQAESSSQLNSFDWDNILDSQIAAVIFEPLIQCAGGMLIYSDRWLDELLAECKKRGIITIADEIATGFGRTGRLFAGNYLTQQADIVCLSKALTSGTLPFAAVLATEAIFEAFLSKERSQMFLHSQSYCGNALACAVALSSLDLLLTEETSERISNIGLQHERFLNTLVSSPLVTHPRRLGTIAAFDLITEKGVGYMSSLRDPLISFFLRRGVFLRPLGNIIYILPPYVITSQELQSIYSSIEEALYLLERGQELV